ncbi:Arginyl-tRNA--protein transferase 1 [Mortierella sp. AM989]|nr:Arginyl-tRNA--protein transferase 1 [Mortierella sp. AM989]
MQILDYSIVTPYGKNVSSCGYCKSANGSRTYGMIAHLMTPKDYQKLINRGWRRYGKYLYKPNLRDSCCPQYTIRLKASEFEASRHQRQVVNRFNNFVQEGDEKFEKDIASRQKARQQNSNTENKSLDDTTASTSATETPAPTTEQKQKPRKPPKNAATDLRTRIHSSEYLLSPGIKSWKHRLRITLEPSSYTEEKFNLFAKYQMEVHHEPKSRVHAGGYRDFLVSTPLTPTKEPENWTQEDPGFGSFHQCYYLDEKLIAVSVIDILPECVSAVYFYYDTDYSILSLGKYSAQREIALVETLNAMPGYENLQYYYMGYYIFTCPKMAYKGQFHPSYLLDPETYNWVEFEKCREILDGQRYSAFENPVPMNPLFEEKMKMIHKSKRGQPENDDSEDYEDDIDDWQSVDEDDDDDGDDDGGDEIDGPESDNEQENSNRRKKKRLNETSEEKAAKKKKEEEMDRVYHETLALPPPGCRNPVDLTDEDLSAVYSLINKELQSIAASFFLQRDIV